jgi:hypothetical protein
LEAEMEYTDLDQLADDPEYVAWLEREDERGELAGSPEKIGCRDCGPDQPLQKVVALAGSTGGPDPYQRYRLECGHVVVTFPDTPCE